MTHLAENSALTCRVHQFAWRIAGIQDTISELTTERQLNTESIRPSIHEVFRVRRYTELTPAEFVRVRVLKRIRDRHYAAIADALLEGQ